MNFLCPHITKELKLLTKEVDPKRKIKTDKKQITQFLQTLNKCLFHLSLIIMDFLNRLKDQPGDRDDYQAFTIQNQHLIILCLLKVTWLITHLLLTVSHKENQVSLMDFYQWQNQWIKMSALFQEDDQVALSQKFSQCLLSSWMRLVILKKF